MPSESDRLVTVLNDVGLELFNLMARITMSESTAEELLQQVVLRIVERQDRMANVQNLAAYLRRSAIRAAFTWRRDHRVRRADPLPSELPDQQPKVSHPLELREEASIALEALDELSPATREVVVMRFLNEESYEEIASQLGKTPHQVRSLCSKGIQMLRKKLQSQIAQYEEDDQ